MSAQIKAMRVAARDDAVRAPLPPGWEERKEPPFYVNPTTGEQLDSAPAPLPPGWDVRKNPTTARPVYVETETRATLLRRPTERDGLTIELRFARLIVIALTAMLVEELNERGRFRAMMSAAHDRAREVAERAARVLEEGNRRLRRGDARGALARFSDYRALGRRLFDPDKRRRAEGRALGSLGRAHAKLGQHSEAVGALEAAIAVSRELGDRTSEALRLNCLGDAHAGGGQHDIAITCYARARALSAARGRQLESALDAARAALETREQEANALEMKLYAMRARGEGGLADSSARDVDAQLRDANRECEKSRREHARLEKEGRDARCGEAVAIGGLGSAYNSLGQHDKAAEKHGEALKICKALGDREGEGVQKSDLGRAYRGLGQFNDAIQAQQEALEISRELGDREGEASRLSALGDAYDGAGRHKNAVACHWAALRISRERGDRRAEGRDMSNLGNALQGLGHCEATQMKTVGIGGSTWKVKLGDSTYDLALRAHEAALAVSQETGADPRVMQEDLIHVANAWHGLDHHEKAIDLGREALTLSRETGDRRAECHNLIDLGAIGQSLGKSLLEKAEGRAREATGALSGMCRPVVVKQDGPCFGQKVGQRAEPALVERLIEMAEKNPAKELQLRQATSHDDLLALARAWFRKDISDKAEDEKEVRGEGLEMIHRSIFFYESALEVARKTGDKKSESAALRAIGLAHRSFGDYEKTIECHRKAAKIRREMSDRGGEAADQSSIGNAYKEIGKYEMAIASLEEAHKLHEEIGDRRGVCDDLGSIGIAHFHLYGLLFDESAKLKAQIASGGMGGGEDETALARKLEVARRADLVLEKGLALMQPADDVADVSVGRGVHPIFNLGKTPCSARLQDIVPIGTKEQISMGEAEKVGALTKFAEYRELGRQLFEPDKLAPTETAKPVVNKEIEDSKKTLIEKVHKAIAVLEQASNYHYEQAKKHREHAKRKRAGPFI